MSHALHAEKATQNKKQGKATDIMYEQESEQFYHGKEAFRKERRNRGHFKVRVVGVEDKHRDILRETVQIMNVESSYDKQRP